MSITVIKSVPAKVGTVITEDSYKTLLGMIKSSDKADHLVAQKILNECDIQKSIYWIWKLAKSSGVSNMVYLRTKASRSFNKEVENVYSLGYKDKEQFAKFLIRKGWMTEEIFGYLRAGIVDLVELRAKNDFFDVYYIVKEEMMQYHSLEKDQVI